MTVRETLIAAPLTVGCTGDDVKKAQEWLTLAGLGLRIDGVFGDATAAAVREFQQSSSLPVTGVVDQPVFSTLTGPITRAIATIASTASLGADVCRVATQHIAEKPREIGGENRGPWVRLYLHGEEGPDWPWCAGFASYVIAQAVGQRPVPFEGSPSCDQLAENAKKAGLFRSGDDVDVNSITPGTVFLVRRPAAPGWHHTGIVVSATPATLTTIEGNTNDNGSREGYEAIRRFRANKGLDFIAMPT